LEGYLMLHRAASVCLLAAGLGFLSPVAHATVLIEYAFTPETTLTFADSVSYASISSGGVWVLYSSDAQGNIVDGPAVLEHLFFGANGMVLSPTQLLLVGSASEGLITPITGTLSGGQLDFGGQVGTFATSSYLYCSGGAPCQAVNAPPSYDQRNSTDVAPIPTMAYGGTLRGTLTGIDFPIPVDPALIGQVVPGGLAAFTGTLTFAAVPEAPAALLACLALALVTTMHSASARTE
jgi:hypothetical protein